MAFLSPDNVRYDNGVKICEKLIPDSAVWNRDYTEAGYTYRKGTQYKANRALSAINGVTIHNTGRIKVPSGTTMAEQYTRATYPNCNMGSVRVHYYVDENEAWQNLDEGEVGWHAADGNYGPGNSTTIAIEIIMDGTGAEYNRIAEDNGARLCAAILKRHGLNENAVYQHHDWYARKDCPAYIRPHWSAFLALVRQYLNDDAQVPSDYDKLVAELEEIKENTEPNTPAHRRCVGEFSPLWSSMTQRHMTRRGNFGTEKEHNPCKRWRKQPHNKTDWVRCGEGGRSSRLRSK